MQFKRSAGIYVAGICLFIGGPLLSFIGTTFGTWSSLSNPANARELTALFIGLTVFGILLSIVGFFMLVVAAHRALVKIDALPVRAMGPTRQAWSSRE